ncbi:MAG TPA: hypothetical protein VHN20_16115 [Beijerinckiaceae bacterium]|nr:hypothetical protein [Beijerinckiaceae bacterium]
MRLITLSALALYALTIPASAGTSVAQFSDWPEQIQLMYVSGVHDGFLSLRLKGDDVATRDRLNKCLSNLETGREKNKAFQAWIRAHPRVMALEVHSAYGRFAFDTCQSH